MVKARVDRMSLTGVEAIQARLLAEKYGILAPLKINQLKSSSILVTLALLLAGDCSICNENHNITGVTKKMAQLLLSSATFYFRFYLEGQLRYILLFLKVRIKDQDAVIIQ
jgi:hypothetical protein